MWLLGFPGFYSLCHLCSSISNMNALRELWRHTFVLEPTLCTSAVITISVSNMAAKMNWKRNELWRRIEVNIVNFHCASDWFLAGRCIEWRQQLQGEYYWQSRNLIGKLTFLSTKSKCQSKHFLPIFTRWFWVVKVFIDKEWKLFMFPYYFIYL